MKHARADYDRIQDTADAIALAELVLSMGMVTNRSSIDICNIAREHAAKMDAWPKKKIADLPAGMEQDQ